MKSHLAALLCVVLSLVFLTPPAWAETPAERDARMEWWRDAKFGMFIHWGVYSVPAGTYHGEKIGGIGEWIMRRAEIPVAEYREYAQDFDPVKYDPEQWAALAKRAGMKYVVITSKHHDGFALYDSAVTDWDIADASPYGKDLLAPLADAVRDEGLKFGLYYSQAQDWTHPGGAKAGLAEGQSWDEANKGDFDEYLRTIALPQTKEVLTKFHPDVLWWDTPTWMNAERAKPLHDLLADYPEIITNNRLGGGYRGDTETPEQHIPATGYKDRDWETCMTMNNTWGFKSYDHNWKSTEVLLHNLVDIVSKGGNYLLNVGPTKEGEIPQESIDRLTEIGEWMDTNGASIYGTTASPCRRPDWGRITSKPGKLYLHVFDWPSDGKLVVPVEVETSGCHPLADASRNFDVSKSDAGVVVHLTGDAVDPIDTVVELEISGTPKEIFRRVAPAANGTLVLQAGDAVIEGNAQVESIGNQPNIGFWTDAADVVVWNCKSDKPGKYRLAAEVAAPASSKLVVSVGDAKANVAVKATGGYQDFESQDWGEVELKTSGKFSVKIMPKSGQWQAINLRSLKLTPVK
ncbi:alpha-L-fucosidase [Aeoliella sp. ICT_H6.2]|uniref:alpha-L-fucosidase n=1 Tax=Aeoliella straminimaris TaxID=2954799 RepID=A0A9X2FH14_9BACT|nr:alpha-L-fucosidase [Aeoliella straminimaris]MCO6045516.1 alpha-L-fucosidase [Aeoliella straminimaris]